jgi:hypothetical protein
MTQTHAMYNHLIFDKEPKICAGEKIASSTNDAGKSRFPPAETKTRFQFLTLH